MHPKMTHLAFAWRVARKRALGVACRPLLAVVWCAATRISFIAGHTVLTTTASGEISTIL